MNVGGPLSRHSWPPVFLEISGIEAAMEKGIVAED